MRRARVGGTRAVAIGLAFAAVVLACSSAKEEATGDVRDAGGSRDEASPQPEASSPPLLDASVDDGGEASTDASANASTDDAGLGLDAASEGGSGAARVCLAPLCPPGEKWCGACVPIADPRFGCGAISCAACTIASSVAGLACVAGQCTITSCVGGTLDCNLRASDGCESDPGSRASCGGCGIACPANEVCDDGQCKAACAFPETSCSGACRDLASDAYGCGACGVRCLGATCVNGACASPGAACPPGTHVCPVGVNPHCAFDEDPDRCGASCVTCPSEFPRARACVAGVCGFAGCLPGYTSCGGACVATTSDAANCGGCGLACAPGEACVKGTCVAPSSLRLASGLVTPEDIVHAGPNLFVTDVGANSVLQVDKVTGAVTTLGTNQASPRRVRSDGAFVYWTSYLGNAVLRAPVGGGAPPTVLASLTRATGLAIDGETLWVSASGGTYGVPKAGGAPVLLTSLLPDPTEDILVLPDAIYLMQISSNHQTTVLRVTRAGALTTFWGDSSRDYHGLVEGNGALYFQVGPLGQVPFPPAVYGFPLSAVSLRRYGASPARGTAQHFDGCMLFFVGDGAGVYAIDPLAGAAITLTDRAVKAHRVTADETSVYWADASGFVGRVAR